jgi:hypothetical protein
MIENQSNYKQIYTAKSETSTHPIKPGKPGKPGGKEEKRPGKFTTLH